MKELLGFLWLATMFNKSINNSYLDALSLIRDASWILSICIDTVFFINEYLNFSKGSMLTFDFHVIIEEILCQEDIWESRMSEDVVLLHHMTLCFQQKPHHFKSILPFGTVNNIMHYIKILTIIICGFTSTRSKQCHDFFQTSSDC